MNFVFRHMHIYVFTLLLIYNLTSVTEVLVFTHFWLVFLQFWKMANTFELHAD